MLGGGGGCQGLSLSPCRDYVRRELEYGFQGAVYSDPVALGRFATTLAGEPGGGSQVSPARGRGGDAGQGEGLRC